MAQILEEISRAYLAGCTRAAVFFHRQANVLLFLMGVTLLSIGMERLSTAEGVRPAEPATNKPAEGAQGRPAPGAVARPAPGAFARPAPGAFARPAPGALSRPGEGAVNRAAEAALNRAAEAAQSRPAELAQHRPAEEADIPYDDTLVRNSVGNLFKFIEGAFGALLVVGAGIGAIIAATLGAYKAALALLVVSVGAFILRAYVSLFFGTNYPDYEVGDF